MFGIQRVTPIYDHSTDARIGTMAILLPMTYQTYALAAKLAAKYEQECWDNCGDDFFHVVYLPSGVQCPRHPAPDVQDDDIPF